MQAAASRGEAPAVSVAYLTDRVLVNEGKPQRYGTQMTMQGDQIVPKPIEDAEHVDARRASVGLPPMAEYRRKVLSALAEIKAEKPGGSAR